MRSLTPEEIPLIRHLFCLAKQEVNVELLQVTPMQDGGMGSLRIAPFGEARVLAQVAAEYAFPDRDGVLVSATLNLDQNGQPFEVDVWRVDFAPLLQWPSNRSIGCL